MRTLASFIACIALTACGAGPSPTSTDPPSGGSPPAPPPAPTPTHEITLPPQYASSLEVTAYAGIKGYAGPDSEAKDQLELSYGLAEGYPTQVTIAARDGYVLAPGCETRLGPVTWKSILELQGTAAKLDLDEGTLSVDLHEEGDVSALLEGEILDQHCTTKEGQVMTSIPLKHRVELRVRRVAGFVVEQLQQHVTNCVGTLVLPSGAPMRAPDAWPLDAEGALFMAANAPQPVAITLRSDSALTPLPDRQLSAAPGTVTVSADTDLPVEGLASFEVVGPDALTSVEAELYLRKAVAKGSVFEPIEEGMSYEILFPEQSNEIGVQLAAAMTAHGKLCANVPGSWFAATSSTPSQCEAGAEDPEDFPSSFVPVAAVRAPGECRLEVTIPGTSHQWTTTFTTH